MAQGTLPSWILLEDAIDLPGFLEASGRVVHRTRWAGDCAMAAQRAAADRMNDGVF